MFVGKHIAIIVMIPPTTGIVFIKSSIRTNQPLIPKPLTRLIFMTTTGNTNGNTAIKAKNLVCVGITDANRDTSRISTNPAKCNPRTVYQYSDRDAVVPGLAWVTQSSRRNYELRDVMGEFKSTAN